MLRSIVKKLAALLIGAALITPAAYALNLGSAAASYDGVYYVSQYPDGDKPQTCGAVSDDGWTLASKGSGFGEICKVSSTEFDFATGGSSASNGFRYAYKNVASGDFQLKARVTNEYTGATAAFAGVGITISDGTADADVIHNVFSPNSSSTIVRSLSGVPDATTATNGAAGQTRPRYICAGYDESETESQVLESSDGSTWVALATFDYAFSSPIVGLYGNSGSASDTLFATMDNIELRTGGSAINCWTPNPPPPGAPTLVTPIGPQSGTQAVAFNLSCALNWTGQTPLTHPYTISGLQGGGALSFDGSICALTGTPNASDVGTYNVTITAKNVGGDTPDTFSMSIAPPPAGDILTLPTNGTTVNCNTFESGGVVDPGDILQFNGTTHAPLRITNCHGTANNPIVIRNDPNDASPATIKRTSTGIGYVLNCENCTHVVIDGTQGWVGHASPLCGTTGSTGAHAEGTDCGIILTKDAAPLTQPTWYLRLTGTTGMPAITVKGVAVLALSNSVGTGICYSLNDHSVTGTANPGSWREDIYFQNNYGDHCGAEGEGFYIGGNDQDDPVPLRNIHFIDNLITDGGRDGINAKSVFSGTNEMTGNHIYRVGLPPTQDKQNSGIALESAASWTISKNKIVGPGGNCIKLQQNPDYGRDTATPASTFTIENNFMQDCGGNPVQAEAAGNAFKSQGSASALSDTIIIFRNNTVDSAKGGMVDASGSNMQQAGDSCIAINNIFSSGGSPVLNNCSGTNTVGSTASQLYTSGTDLHLTNSSPACGQSTNNAPTDDYDAQTRATNGKDMGADERSTCVP